MEHQCPVRLEAFRNLASNFRVGILVANAAAAVMVGDKRHQRQVPGPLNSDAQDSLMPGAHARPAAWLYFGPV